MITLQVKVNFFQNLAASKSEDSVTQIAYSLASEQKEREMPTKHHSSQLRRIKFTRGAMQESKMTSKNVQQYFKLTYKPLLPLQMLSTWAKSLPNLNCLRSPSAVLRRKLPS